MRQSMLVAKTAAKNQKREVKVRVAGKSALARFVLGPFGQALISDLPAGDHGRRACSPITTRSTRRVFDEKLKAGLFANSAKIFAAPDSVGVGDTLTPGANRGPATPQRLHGIAQ